MVEETRTAPPGVGGGEPEESHHDEEMPRLQIRREHAIVFALFVASAVAFLYFVLPQLTGLGETWHRVKQGSPWWLALAAACELLSFGGYVLLFRTVFVTARSRIDWRASYEITMAGVAATRLFAAAGAGGIALTAWALRRSGMGARTVAVRMVAFNVALYAIYALAMVLDGLGMYTGLLPGGDAFALTMVPAIFGAGAMLVVFSAALLPTDIDRRLARWSRGRARAQRWLRRLGTVPASLGQGVREAVVLLRRRPSVVAGAVAWWAFDVAVLWAGFRAFGGAPELSVIVMAFFVGMLGNLLPLPGGIGGVEGGMIGTLIAFGVDEGLAVVAVLVFRGMNFWLPTVPGAIAYFQLRKTVGRWRRAEPRTASA